MFTLYIAKSWVEDCVEQTAICKCRERHSRVVAAVSHIWKTWPKIAGVEEKWIARNIWF